MVMETDHKNARRKCEICVFKSGAFIRYAPKQTSRHNKYIRTEKVINHCEKC